MSLEKLLSGVSEEANRNFLKAMDNARYHNIELPPTAPDSNERYMRAIDLATAAANIMYKEGMSKEQDAALKFMNAYRWHPLQSIARGANATKESPIPEEVRESLPLHANAMLSAGILTYCVPRDGFRRFNRDDWERTSAYEKAGQLIATGIGFIEGLHRKHYDSDPRLPVSSFREDAKRGKQRYHLREKVLAEENPLQLAALMEKLQSPSGRLDDEVIEDLIREKSQGMVLSAQQIKSIEKRYGESIAREMAPLHYDRLDRIQADRQSQTSLFS